MIEKRNITSITGVSGAGKDFLIRQAQLKDYNFSQIPVINGGTELIKLLKNKNVIDEKTTRDQLKNIIKDENLEDYIKEIVATLDPQKMYIFNGHIVTKSGNFLKFNPEIEKNINPRNYVIIIADPSDIIKWRKGDISRQRTIETYEKIELEQKLTVSIVTTIALSIGSKIITLDNNPSQLQENIDQIINL